MIAAVKEWAYVLFLTAAAGGIALLVSPDNPKMKKYVKFAVTVCAAAVMLLPLKNIISASFAVENVESAQFDYADEIAQRKVEEIICGEINERICESFGFYADSLYFDGDVLIIETDTPEIADFVRSLYFGEVEILS